jgi:putative endonuclease
MHSFNKQHKDILGMAGEQAAADHLESLGFMIIHRNWRHQPYEIDIVATDNDELVIVEVKTRATDEFGDPQDFVSRRKQSQLVKAAQLYAQDNNVDMEIRFDVVAVIINRFGTKLEHIKGAFIPLLGM